MPFDPYEILGVRAEASAAEIESAFDACLARLAGPDGVVHRSYELTQFEDAYVALGGYLPGLSEGVARGDFVLGEEVGNDAPEPPGRRLRRLSAMSVVGGGFAALFGVAVGELGGILVGAFATFAGVIIWFVARSVDRGPTRPRPATPFDRSR